MAKSDCIKLLAVGDGTVGKTCQFITYTTDEYPNENVPTVFDNYCITVCHKGKDYRLALWDPYGGEDYHRLRPLSYPQTDIFIICYDVANRDSFHNIKDYWFPELDYHCPETPRLIVACKTDLRACESSLDFRRGPMVTYEEGLALATSLKARFCETSSKKGEGLKQCFDQAVELGVLNLEHINRFKTLFSSIRSKKNKGGPIIPPVLPPAGATPSVEIIKTTFADEWYATLQDSKFHDVTFVVEGEQHLHAHKMMLCAASTFFNKVFCGIMSSSKSQAQEFNSIDGFSREDLNSGEIEGISAVYDKEESDKSTVVVELDIDIPAKMFVRCLEFIYTGYPRLPDDAAESEWDSLRKVANKFNLSFLCQICTNIINNEGELLNPSIATYLNSNTGSQFKEMYFNNESAQPDVVFNVEGSKIYAHKVVLSTRSPVMAAMFSGKFIEGVTLSEIKIEEVAKENFLALLEYLYSDHAPIEQMSDIIGLLALADEKGVHGLVNLCELSISKEVEKACEDEEQIEKADIDMIGLLNTARMLNAKRLVDWCLHFISTNYIPFSKRQDFSNLTEEDRKHVEENQWPPLSYLQEKEEYERKMGGSKKRDKCSIM